MEPALFNELSRRSLEVRRDVIRMMGVARMGDLASSLSVVDLLVWLYGTQMSVRPQQPLWEDRDRFVLGMGAASPALYAVLAETGFFSREELWNYRRLGSTLQAFADAKRTAGVDASCGIAGMGSGIALGMALAMKSRVPAPSVYCLIAEQELQIGSVWEVMTMTARMKLANLTLILNSTRSSEDDDGEAVAKRLRVLGFAIAEADGHDFESLAAAMASLPSGAARMIVANTRNGRGVDFLERGFMNGEIVLDRQTTDELLSELEEKR